MDDAHIELAFWKETLLVAIQGACANTALVGGEGDRDISQDSQAVVRLATAVADQATDLYRARGYTAQIDAPTATRSTERVSTTARDESGARRRSHQPLKETVSEAYLMRRRRGLSNS